MTFEAVDFNPDEARTFADEVATASGQNLSACYQCRKCAAGCPVAEATGFFTPDRLIRTVVMGDEKSAQESPLTWKCVSCYTCGTRCPNGIQTGKITEALKRISKKNRVYPQVPKIASFHAAFVSAFKRRGRINETEFMAGYEMRHMTRLLMDFNFPAIIGESFSQARLGLSMLKQKRLHIGLTRVKDVKEVRGLFSGADESENHRE